MEKMLKTMSSDKLTKNAKLMTKMFQQMDQIAKKAGIMDRFFETFNSLLTMFEGADEGIAKMSGYFEKLGAEIIPGMNEHLAIIEETLGVILPDAEAMGKTLSFIAYDAAPLTLTVLVKLGEELSKMQVGVAGLLGAMNIQHIENIIVAITALWKILKPWWIAETAPAKPKTQEELEQTRVATVTALERDDINEDMRELLRALLAETRRQQMIFQG